MHNSILLDLQVTLFLVLRPQVMSPHTQSLSFEKPRIVFAVCCSAAFGVAARHMQDPGAGARVSHLTASLPFRSWMTCVPGSAMERMADLLPSWLRR